MIDRCFLKESGFGPAILLELGDRGDMAEILLGNVLIIEVEIALRGGLQVTGGGEGRSFQYLSATQPLKRSIMPLVCGWPGLIKRWSMPWWAQVRSKTYWPLAGGAKAVGKLLAVVGQRGANHNGALARKRSRKPAAAVLSGRISR